MNSKKVNIFWFRRDLRLDDNVGFQEALESENPVLPIFILDFEILENLPKDDARVTFIHQNLVKMRKKLRERGGSIAVYHGKPATVFRKLTENYQIEAVYTNHDYEPYARDRDNEIKSILSAKNIEFHTYKDQVIFEKNEITKSDGGPYVVYTPYMKRWKEKFRSTNLKIYNAGRNLANIVPDKNLTFPELSEIGFRPSEIKVPNSDTTSALVQNYEDTRNIPSLEGTSRLGAHLRFGTVSIRKVVRIASAEKNETFLQELIWREFFMQVLYHYPHTVTDAFKPKYDRIEWRNNKEEFQLWKEGKTGYPLVDAGMRQLNKTGFMHNRVRMLVGSFLCKHLLIDWRWGEAYFAEKLLDYEMSSNVGNWQWVAGSGVDAAPYFRIFNPTTQIEKFDKERKYIKKWVPEYGTDDYPEKMVGHKEARERALKIYKEAVST